MEKQQFQLSIAGLGIIFYAPHAVRHIEEGEDYLGEHYSKPKDVIPHIYEGSIVGVATGSPGIFHLNIYQYVQPDLDALQPDYALKLCLKVTEHTVYFRDLYVLLSWEAETESDIKVDMEDGNYEVIVCSWLPESGIRGKHQQVDFYFNKTDKLPQLRYEGVPSLL